MSIRFLLIWTGCLLMYCLSASAQEYSFMGFNVDKVDAVSGEVLSSGELLMEYVLQESETELVEIRYGTDTEIENQFGQPVLVERIMDFYYPTSEVKFFYENEEIVHLPVVVLLHAGAGTKNTMTAQAIDWARKGYAVLVPTYRSDRSLVNYCLGYENTVYGMVQDIRAVLRHFAKAHDDAMALPLETILSLYGEEAATFAAALLESRCDANSIFFSGHSGGGTAGFHTSLRIHQESFPDYLVSEEPYLIDGPLGLANLSQNGSIDAVGTSYSEGYPFPVERLKGTIARTVGVGNLDIINYENHPNPVPVCLIHGTCDKALPYMMYELIGANNICDARVTYPDGTQDSVASVFGSDPISKAVALAGAYAEMVTFCGGGHASNQCVTDIIETLSVEFIKRILNNNYSNGDLNEIVYRYHEDNYSNQCCQIDELYTYLEKCSCDGSNPFDVIELPFISLGTCQFADSCGLEDYCELLPVSVSNTEMHPYNFRIVAEGGDVLLYFNAFASEITSIKVFSADGMQIFQAEFPVVPGENRYTLPANLPKRQLLVASLNAKRHLKFVLE